MSDLTVSLSVLCSQSLPLTIQGRQVLSLLSPCRRHCSGQSQELGIGEVGAQQGCICKAGLNQLAVLCFPVGEAAPVQEFLVRKQCCQQFI